MARKEKIIHAAFWIIGTYLIAINPLIHFKNFSSTNFIFSTCINILITYLNIFVLLPDFIKEKSKKNSFRIILYYISLSLLETLINYFIFQFNDYEDANLFEFKWLILVWGNIIFNGFFFIIAVVYVTIKEWISFQKRERELINEKKIAEVSFLKSQINPHFLFNALNTVYGIARKGDIDHTTESISQLSEMMRYVFKSSEAKTVPLLEEIDYIKNFIKKEKE